MTKRLEIVLFSCFIFLASCKNSKEFNKIDVSDNLNQLFNDFQDFKLQINPIEATKAGYSAYNDTIANYISDEYQDYLIANYTSFLERIKAIDTANIGETQKLALAVMKWDCAIKKEGVENSLAVITSPIYNLPTLELFPLGQIQSLHLYVAQLAGGTSVHPFNTVKDYDDWLERINDYLSFLDSSISKMQEGIDNNIVLPKALVVKMIPQLENFVSVSVENHLFYKPILQIPDTFKASEKERLTSAYKEVISQRIIPKYTELKLFLEEVYLPNARTSSGISSLANGKETYNYLIRLHTTTNMTADEIHELGKSEVARIRGEMAKAMKALDFNGDLMDFFEHVRSNKNLMPFTKPEAVITHFKSIEQKMDAKLDSVFNLRPKAGFNVKRTEAFREASASAEYVPGSKDAKRPGVFYVPIPNVEEFNILTSEALFLHEAVPGHHFQLSLQQENTDLPEFLHPESMGVFVEGWALYAESLGRELGLYKNPYQYFGMLSMEMHRAIRLVVDTGIHAKGWTREEAIQYSLDNEADSEAGIIAEIERYMATPGQALSYKIGQLKIRELRNKAEKSLGDNFNIGDFHDQVLNSGSLPLLLLEKKIDNWINKVKSK